MHHFGLAGVTVTDLNLAGLIKHELPELEVAASVLMDIGEPYQAMMLDSVCDVLVPASRIMRDQSALQRIREAFGGRIRLMVNEACLPGCPFRTQHFYEMGSGHAKPASLCNSLLEKFPWLRLTGTWVLPQHLHLYRGLWDELKLAGRITLQDPDKYRQVLAGYINRTSLTPDAIGGGPASVLTPVEIEENYYSTTLACGKNCQECSVCKEYYQKVIDRAEGRVGKSCRPTSTGLAG